MIATPRMLRVPPFERGITLGDFLVPIRVGERASSRQRHVLMVAMGTLLIVLGARAAFYLPGNPLVPITLQTFGVLFGGALLGSRRGVLSVLLYLMLGIVGLPVFAQGESGLDALATYSGGRLVLGASGGYLFGFVLASALVGRLAELGWDRHIGGSVAALVLGNAVIYAVGVPWLALAAELDGPKALEFGLYPFLVGDLIKLALAAALLPVGWWLVRRRSGDL
jgi:biotin transport system substrate-specific component